jgi:predicted nucleic acid-binding protein
MAIKLFLDTNILVSGIFFEGNEALILDTIDAQLMTCEDSVSELFNVVKRKIKYLGDRNLEIALEEVNQALGDMEILPRIKYAGFLETAAGLINHAKDVPVLAATLFAKPTYLITGDDHFFTRQVKDVIQVRKARAFLDEVLGN